MRELCKKTGPESRTVRRVGRHFARAWRREPRATRLPYTPRLLPGFDRSELTHQAGGPGDTGAAIYDRYAQGGTIFGLTLYHTALPHGVSARALKVDLNFAYTSTSFYLKALYLASAPQARLGSRRVGEREEEGEG